MTVMTAAAVLSAVLAQAPGAPAPQCGTFDLGCKATDAVGSVFDGLVAMIAKGAADLVVATATWWVQTDSVNPQDSAVIAAQDATRPVIVVMLVGSVLVQAIRMVLSRKAGSSATRTGAHGRRRGPDGAARGRVQGRARPGRGRHRVGVARRRHRRPGRSRRRRSPRRLPRGGRRNRSGPADPDLAGGRADPVGGAPATQQGEVPSDQSHVGAHDQTPLSKRRVRDSPMGNATGARRQQHVAVLLHDSHR